MKKLFSLILCGILVLGITGCGNNETAIDKNNDNSNNNVQENGNTDKENIKEEKKEALSCSGDYLFTLGFMVGKGQTSDGTQNISYAFDATDDMGKGEYEFEFDDDKLVSMSSVETLSLSYSNQISDSQLNSPDNQIDGCEMYRNSDKRVVIKCNYNESSDYVLALNTNANTPDKLKTILEEKTVLSCK